MLTVRNKENSSEFSKGWQSERGIKVRAVNQALLDDIWAVLPDKEFQWSFLLRSVYYGPTAGGTLEVQHRMLPVKTVGRMITQFPF